MENATEEYIEGLNYHRMYFSPACWKDDHRYVTRELRKLTSESAKYHALKENIMIRVKGFVLNLSTIFVVDVKVVLYL